MFVFVQCTVNISVVCFLCHFSLLTPYLCVAGCRGGVLEKVVLSTTFSIRSTPCIQGGQLGFWDVILAIASITGTRFKSALADCSRFF